MAYLKATGKNLISDTAQRVKDRNWPKQNSSGESVSEPWIFTAGGGVEKKKKRSRREVRVWKTSEEQHSASKIFRTIQQYNQQLFPNKLTSLSVLKIFLVKRQ